jgi:hypothetical protein
MQESIKAKRKARPKAQRKYLFILFSFLEFYYTNWRIESSKDKNIFKKLGLAIKIRSGARLFLEPSPPNKLEMPIF